MIMARMAARHIGVEAFDLVDKAGLLKEVQRPVDGRRLGRAFPVQIGQKVIGFRRPLILQQQAQHLAADARHPLALAGHQRFGLGQEGVHILRGAGRVGGSMIMSV